MPDIRQCTDAENLNFRLTFSVGGRNGSLFVKMSVGLIQSLRKYLIRVSKY